VFPCGGVWDAPAPLELDAAVLPLVALLELEAAVLALVAL
jgi:hypothetical protein